MTRQMKIRGMSCEHCVRAVERALGAVPGVEGVEVAVGQATVRHAAQCDPRLLRAAIEDAGYELEE